MVGGIADPCVGIVEHASCSDDQLVTLYLEGNGQAFHEITRRHYKKLWWLAKKYTQSATDADDIMQESLLKASHSLHRYRRDAALSTWLYKLVANTAYDYVLRRRERNFILVDDYHEAAIASGHPSSHDPLDAHETTMSVSRAVQQLAPDQRTAIELVDIMGYDINLAAAITGVKPGTIKSRRARAKTQLQTMLEPLMTDN
ncbi:RNA polymerase sigma factor [Corynebacterium diphtheriae]|nr:RNA polymerase sigma factor [Corynebacterium diphtheriae]CAB0763551.1 RNA polymerase sigma factor [Corynebacterium diphtheriae]CAB0796734.1 RNA polymerase sigma factor [Corynebacterium diphtheriae]CAB1038007.1 RNA polymerase sigma factor [Corynebacterium diphtheriae]